MHYIEIHIGIPCGWKDSFCEGLNIHYLPICWGCFGGNFTRGNYNNYKPITRFNLV